MRGPIFADNVFRTLKKDNKSIASDLVGQRRLEVDMIDDFEKILSFLSELDINYVVFNNHLTRNISKSNKRLFGITG
ncbi:MAG: hypothetical protein OXC62_14680 [Aestuariivita sp.]|nr:hypothetical protein [Aestuariivita sp.]